MRLDIFIWTGIRRDVKDAVQLLIYRQLHVSDVRTRNSGGKILKWDDRSPRQITCSIATMSNTNHLGLSAIKPGPLS